MCNSMWQRLLAVQLVWLTVAAAVGKQAAALGWGRDIGDDRSREQLRTIGSLQVASTARRSCPTFKVAPWTKPDEAQRNNDTQVVFPSNFRLHQSAAPSHKRHTATTTAAVQRHGPVARSAVGGLPAGPGAACRRAAGHISSSCCLSASGAPLGQLGAARAPVCCHLEEACAGDEGGVMHQTNQACHSVTAEAADWPLGAAVFVKPCPRCHPWTAACGRVGCAEAGRPAVQDGTGLAGHSINDSISSSSSTGSTDFGAARPGHPPAAPAS